VVFKKIIIENNTTLNASLKSSIHRTISVAHKQAVQFVHGYCSRSITQSVA